MLPVKFTKRWAWENTWLVFSIVSLLLLPWTLALTMVRDLGAVYAALPGAAFVAPLAFGAGWGVAQILFGLSVSRLGLALGYAIIVGLGAVLGTMVPLMVQNREVFDTLRGTFILAGVTIMVAGIAVSAHAGSLREGGRAKRYGAALLIAVICGVLAPMLNFAFAFGQSIADQAARMGTSPESAGYAVWPIALLGGLIPNVAYSIWLLSKNRTWGRFGEVPVEAWAGCAMGALWMGAFAIYGVSSVYLGAFGTSVGWALFQIFMIMTANLSGVLMGEWRSAEVAARRWLWTGTALLAVATIVIAIGNS